MGQPGVSPRQGDAPARLDAVLPLVTTWQAWADEHRRPAPQVMAAFAEAGLLHLLAPRAYGGAELDPLGFLDVVEAIARVDGSAAWTVMTCNEELAIASAYLPEGTVAQLLAAGPATVVAGSGLPNGTSRRVEGGWTVEGRWRFVSGAPCADHLVLGTVVEQGGPGELCFVLVPVDTVEILDTWHVAGLRGTGSHDVVLRDRFVPDDCAGVVADTARTVPDAPFYRLPWGLRFPFPKVGVACGIARAALEDFVALAAEKTPARSRASLRERGVAQAAMGEATAALSSGRAWARDVLGELWAEVEASRPISPDLYARTRLACSNAVAGAVRAVDLVCSAAGSTVNFVGSPLERAFRDVHAVPQHFMVAPYHVATAGRVLLGLEADDPAF